MDSHFSRRLWPIYLSILSAFLSAGVGLLSWLRLFYETRFPDRLWAGNLAVVLPVVVLGGVSTGLIARFWPRFGPLLLPLLINLIWVWRPDTPLSVGWLYFLGSLWISLLLLFLRLTEQERPPPQNGLAVWQGGAIRLLPPVGIVLGLLPLYLFSMSSAVGEADTFEFQVTAPQLGIAHPTGYPLYLLLGKAWTLLPLGTVAWRLNFGTALYGIGAALLCYQIVSHLGRDLLPQAAGVRPVAVLSGMVVGTLPIFWSQAIAAEVYTLHALLLLLSLRLMQIVLKEGRHKRLFGLTLTIWLPFSLGLGLTNHLTALFLLPVAAVALFLSVEPKERLRLGTYRSPIVWRTGWLALLPFALPLALYSYLPLRWQVVNGEPMGVSRFIDWVIGGRFQGALRWDAWLNDPVRYEVVARLFLNEWPTWLLGLAVVGLLFLLVRHWRFGLLLSLMLVGFSFYCLNYFVPDLAVFLLPAQIMVALFVAGGLYCLIWLLSQIISLRLAEVFGLILFTTIAGLLLWQTAGRYPRLDQSGQDGLLVWGRGVLDRGPVVGGAILADSEKIAPLYYLQQAEGVRPDLDMMVLPDEAAYRTELDQRVAAGETVYLARFLPGLAPPYSLHAFGPLTEVRPAPTLDPAATPIFRFDGVEILDVTLIPQSRFEPSGAELNLTWRLNEPVDRPRFVYLRWAGELPISPEGRHPVNNNYPFAAWEIGETVPDTFVLPYRYPAAGLQPVEMALGPPFAGPETLAWQEIGRVDLDKVLPPDDFDHLLNGEGEGGERLYIAADDGIISAIKLPQTVRPGRTYRIEALGAQLDQFQFLINDTVLRGPLRLEAGRHTLAVRAADDRLLTCGWLTLPQPTCPLKIYDVAGISLPDSATNFADKIGLVDIAVEGDGQLTPGGMLRLEIEWLALEELTTDYTVFLQVLDQNDRIVGQIDTKPLQGTRPTDLWTAGERIVDPYQIQLAPDLPAGRYRLIVGFYTLADLRRLPVLGPEGSIFDDKFTYSRLTVE